MPKTRFIHSEMVRPHLLTFLSIRTDLKAQAEKSTGVSAKEKSPILERMGLKNMPAIT
jgi:hypothetical protein